MYNRWFSRHTHRLQGKRVAVCGATGGIGEELCRYLARLGAELWLCCRSEQKAQALMDALRVDHPDLVAHFVLLDLEDAVSVNAAAETLAQTPPHVLIHNAGAYAIPRHTTAQGVDNVFAINCLGPYVLTERLLEPMVTVGGRVVCVGSIAHNYSKIDPADPDFATRTAASKVYGNAKRHLMLALYEEFEDVKGVTLSVVHPGITLTGITDHYPKWLYAIIRHPMKVIFMPPRRAALSVLRGVFESTAYGEWIGPRWCNVWGLPSKKKLRTFTHDEARTAFYAVERLKY
ncbi:MAG: SDR family NAD(P)-dependent oxidoreductase [Clostridia bacterium]|nr:SDR family NAD(P)-dependent oxidoreductase [Clostridia bacterium]